MCASLISKTAIYMYGATYKQLFTRHLETSDRTIDCDFLDGIFSTIFKN